MEGQQERAYKSAGAAKASDAAHGEADAASVASTARTDAVTAGIARRSDHAAETARTRRDVPQANPRQRPRGKAGPDSRGGGTAKASASRNAEAGRKATLQRNRFLRAALADAAAEELDDSDELEGSADLRRGYKAVAGTARPGTRKPDAPADPGRASATHPKGGPAGRSEAPTGHRTAKPATAKAPGASAGKAKDGAQDAEATKARIQSRRAWASARAAQAEGAQAATAASQAARKAGVELQIVHSDFRPIRAT